MLQEFVPGDQRHDWFFHGYCDADSVCRPAFTGVKVRSYPSTAGLTSFGRSAPNAPLAREVTGLLARLGYRGLLDLDIRLDARDGRYHLLDFNPRLGAQFRVFRDAAGTDVALAAYLDLTGQPSRGQTRSTDAASSWRTTTRSARSPAGGPGNSTRAAGSPRCAARTNGPGSPSTTCVHSG